MTITGVSMTQADELLSASYQVYRHVKTNETIVRTIGYSLPASLHAQLWTVVPTTHFASPHVVKETSWNRSDGATAEQASGEPVIALSSRDDGVTSPDFLRYLYNTWGYIPTAMSRNTLAVVGFLDDYPSRTDLTAFMRKYRTDGADAMFTVVEVNHGSYDPSNPNDEANLDIQYAQGIAYPTPQVFHSTGRGLLGTDDRYLSWINSVINQEAIPQTISISYGIYEKIYPRDYTAYLCSLFAQLGARGASILMPSGNEAVGRNCVNSDRSIRFTPHFPATCTWSLSSTCKKHIRAGTVRSLQPRTSQVPISLPSAERLAICRSLRQTFPVAASRITFNALTGSCRLPPPSYRTSATSIKASTSAFAHFCGVIGNYYYLRTSEA